MTSDRLRRLPTVRLAPPLHLLDVRLAATPLARLRGLAALDAAACEGCALLLPRTRSIHTVGMRFALDLIWLDGDGEVVGIDRAVCPGRVRGCRAAHAVLELPAAPRRSGGGPASGSVRTASRAL
ncbi:MAG TPA: DUF192 domain-containing protein [Conexibacter sp.]|jgi:hypothetical protein